MKPSLRYLLITLAMLAFAGNSLLSRLALSTGASDAASFTVVRLVAAALTLWLLVRWQLQSVRAPDTKLAESSEWLPWLSALSLFIYAAAFSWAYVLMPAATGALILFGAVQLSMVVAAVIQGDRLRAWQWLGFCVALLGMVLLTVPTFSTPSALSALAMISAGIAWGVYSLLGRGATQPLLTTQLNFARTLPMAAVLGLAQYGSFAMTPAGWMYALSAGAITSGIGYSIWYKVLPTLKSSSAAGIQLSVPVITVLAAAIILQEPITITVITACLTILGGMALVLRGKRSST